MLALGSLRILLVEDSTTQARFIEQTLHNMDPPPAEVTWTDSLAGALAVEPGSTDLVLLDLVLPDCAGIDTFRAVHSAHPLLPIVVLSGAGDEALAVQAVAEGAQDYLFKAIMSPDALGRAIRFAVERHRSLLELRQAAIVDELTGVYNRRGFALLAEQCLAVARRSMADVTLLFVDVDGLKQVNDVLGHQEGDRLLGDLADLMRAAFRSSDVISRIGGDEFCVLQTGDGDRADAVSRLRRSITGHNASGRRRFQLSCSIGTVTVAASDRFTLAELLLQADRAMYQVKALARPS